MRDADLVLRNGNLLTFDRSSRIASSVAIANGRICMVGSDDEIARNVPPDARTIDLRGRSAMPGFFDGHPHMDREGLKACAGIAISGLRSIDAIVAVVDGAARKAAPGEWIVLTPLGDPPLRYFNDPKQLKDGRFPNSPRSRCGCTEQPCVHSQRVGLVEHASVPLRGKYGGAPVDGGHQQ